MIGNLEFEHKFKLGDFVWIKANETIYKNCKNCKSQSVIRKNITRMITLKVGGVIKCQTINASRMRRDWQESKTRTSWDI